MQRSFSLCYIYIFNTLVIAIVILAIPVVNKTLILVVGQGGLVLSTIHWLADFL